MPLPYNPYAYSQAGNYYVGTQTYQPQQSFAQQAPVQPAPQGMIWVDGEVGAKAFQMPSGWPVEKPIPLWDTNDTIIYLKSMNAMGMPNPLKKIHYIMDEQPNQSAIPAQTSGGMSGADQNMYVSKQEFDARMNELKELITGRTVPSTPERNQNGISKQQNRGG